MVSGLVPQGHRILSFFLWAHQRSKVSAKPLKAIDPAASTAVSRLFRCTQTPQQCGRLRDVVITECLSVSPRLFALCDYSPQLLERSGSCLCDKDIHLPDMKILFMPIPNDSR